MIPLRHLACALAAALLFAPTLHADSTRRVVLIAWDGFRPDMVTPENTPTLWKLAQEGTFFARHHAAYPSTTEVNGTTLATGLYPAHSGLMGNREYRPALNPLEPIGTEDIKHIRLSDSLTHGKFLAAPTLYETVQAAGFRTVVAGTKTVAVLADRRERSTGASASSPVVFAGRTIPSTLSASLQHQYGKFPEKPTFPDIGQNTWTVDVLLGTLWKSDIPRLTLLWLSDPDFSQHDSQPGSSKALASLRANDKLLARLLATLEARGVRAQTDILLVSDHGFSTISQTVDFSVLLRQAGFPAYRKFEHPAQPGDIMVVGNGGSVFFYVIGRDRAATARLATFLRTRPEVGVVFSRVTPPGTFPLSAVRIDSPASPDVVISLPWSNQRNASGVKGEILSDQNLGTAKARKGAKTAGQGMHGSLSPWDMHNTLIANGPDFRRGFVSSTPSGNIDVTPTILHLLGIKPTRPLDGRVLREALATSAGTPPPQATTSTRLGNQTQNGTPTPRQYLQTTTVHGTQYFDQGGPGTPPSPR